MGYPAVGDKDFNVCFVPIPPLPEQRRIVEYLDKTLDRLNGLTSLIRRQIETLTAYRKSLIHECVTGQRRITEAR